MGRESERSPRLETVHRGAGCAGSRVLRPLREQGKHVGFKLRFAIFASRSEAW